MEANSHLNDLYIIMVEKRENILYGEVVLELPILNARSILVCGSAAVSDYVLTSAQFINSMFQAGMWVDLTLEQIDQINKCWDICVSKNLDYMNLKFK